MIPRLRWPLWLLAAAMLTLALPARADQPVYQTGTALSRHLAVFSSQGKIKDPGDQLGAGGGIASLPVINSTVARPVCIYDAAPTPGPAHSLCLGPSGITVQSLGGASASTFGITVDGVTWNGVAGGVTNALSLTNHAPVVGDGGVAGIKTTAALTNGQLLVGATGADPAPQTMSGDGTLTAGGALTVTKTNGVSLTALATTVPGTNVATFLATPSSANLAAALTDETGSGAAVFGTSPTFTTGLTVNTGANTSPKIAQRSDDTTYNFVSLNGTTTLVGGMGIMGGKSGDSTLFVASPGAAIDFRVGGAQEGVTGGGWAFGAPTGSVKGTGTVNVAAGIWNNGKLAISPTAPTISSGFGTSPSVVANNGPLAFTVNVGTGGSATSGVIGLPTAATGWSCKANDITTQSATVFVTKQTAVSTTTATLGNFNTSGAAAAWVASDVLSVNCFPY